MEMTDAQIDAYDIWWLRLSANGDPSRIANLTSHAFVAGWEASSSWNYDMEAAPKDGTHIMLSVKATSFTASHVTKGYYSAQSSQWFSHSGFKVTPYAWRHVPEPAEVR